MSPLVSLKSYAVNTTIFLHFTLKRLLWSFPRSVHHRLRPLSGHMHGLLATPVPRTHSPTASLLRAILSHITAIRSHKLYNLSHQRPKMLYRGRTQRSDSIKAHFGTKTPVQWKPAQLTSVNDGQGRGRNIARVVLIQCERAPRCYRERCWEFTQEVIRTSREFARERRRAFAFRCLLRCSYFYLKST